MDALLLAIVVGIVGATAIPLLERASRQAKQSTLLQNLHTLRSQIELYKLEHRGEPPLLYQGTFPQLCRATNADGMPGEPGSKFSYGPYLTGGVPVNPITGRSVVTLTSSFPPRTPSGNGGWLYHAKTGQIAIDLEGFLDQ
jgi:general secretion pathway protein G